MSAEEGIYEYYGSRYAENSAELDFVETDRADLFEDSFRSSKFGAILCSRIAELMFVSATENIDISMSCVI